MSGEPPVEASEGAHEQARVRAVPPAWPALVALAVVAVLAVGMLGVEVLVGDRIADRTDQLVGNSLRSVALADDLRYQAYRLSTPNLDGEEIASIAEQIDADGRAFAPLATGFGEAAEWERLQGLLVHLRREQPRPESGASEPLIAQIETSIARLVEINQAEARKNAHEIADAHREGLFADVVAGVVTLIAAGLVAVMLVRSLRHQRELTRMQLENLDERNRELAAFAARVAHDLRGPLAPVKGYADLLEMRGDPKSKDVAARIARSANRMAGIIDDLLALSTHGKPAPGRVAVQPVVRELLDELHGELGDADVDVHVDEVTTACSAGVLGQILRNLVTNASKYRAPDRRLALRIEAHQVAGQVEIEVTDNGIGMAPEIARHAFEPFYRAPGAGREGHGLGLAIVKRTVDAIGGKIDLDTHRGQGTSVRVSVPAAAAA